MLKEKKPKEVKITIGYYPKASNVTAKQLDYINMLMDEQYPTMYGKVILKSGLRNPFRRITALNASKLISALENKYRIIIVDKG
jgi:hypothetical protein